MSEAMEICIDLSSSAACGGVGMAMNDVAIRAINAMRPRLGWPGAQRVIAFMRLV